MNIDISVLLPVVGLLVALVNVITQVLKKVTWDKIPTNIVVLLLSVALTLATFVAYCQIEGIQATWYMILAAIVGGFAVAYRRISVARKPPFERGCRAKRGGGLSTASPQAAGDSRRARWSRLRLGRRWAVSTGDHRPHRAL